MSQNNKIFSTNSLVLPVYLILSSLIILFPVFYNGYPLFYSDSALYILASNLFGALINTENLPYLSGMGYAWFIRIVTWRTTLYLVVFAQALILNILIYHSVKVLVPETKIFKFHLPIIIVLSLFSSMGWTASQLMPDIFTSFLVLAIFLFYSSDKKSFGMYIFLSILVITSILSHLSNITISVLLIGLIFISFLFIKSDRKSLMVFIKKSAVIVALIFSSLLILIGLNHKYYNYNGLSPTGNIFFVARLMDTGFMPEFLNEKCGEKSYEMCRFKDSLPDSYEGFLWNPNSVFNKTGGWNISAHEEYNQIIGEVLTTPKYLGKFLYNCGSHSLHQLITFKIGDGLTTVYNKESSQYQTALRHFDRREFREDYLNSKQTLGVLNFDKVNLINYILLSVSVLIIMWTFIKSKFDRNMILFTVILIGGIILNAIATSSLASVFHRFQSRVIWFIPLLACIYFSAYIYPAIKILLSRFTEIKKIDS